MGADHAIDRAIDKSTNGASARDGNVERQAAEGAGWVNDGDGLHVFLGFGSDRENRG
jgi:hypothetical protein